MFLIPYETTRGKFMSIKKKTLINTFDPTSVFGAAPDYSRAVELPSHSYLTSTSKSETFWIPYSYKINVPGFIYISTKRMIIDTDYSIILGPSHTAVDLAPSNDAYKPYCLLFFGRAQSDDYGDESIMSHLIYPGSSTYARMWIGSNEEGIQNVYFVPCKGVPDTIVSNAFVTSKATTNGIDNDRYNESSNAWASLSEAISKGVFAGDWTSAFSTL